MGQNRGKMGSKWFKGSQTGSKEDKSDQKGSNDLQMGQSGLQKAQEGRFWLCFGYFKGLLDSAKYFLGSLFIHYSKKKVCLKFSAMVTK